VQSRDRGDVDDRAAARVQHQLPQCPRQQERAGEVDLQDASPLLGGGLLGRGEQRDARVVDQYVDPAEAVAHLLGELGRIDLRGHVAHHRVHLRTGVLQGRQRLQRFLQVGQDECVPFARQCLGHLAADALRPTGHHRDRRMYFLLQAHLHEHSVTCSKASWEAMIRKVSFHES
jgi:hypothetical protein